LCERVLVTAWGLLDDYRNDLVLIGGLAPRYLCERSDTPSGTMDVDLGIALGVRGTAHNRIAARLAEVDLKPKGTPEGVRIAPLAKFYRQFPEIELQVEFLADRPTSGAPSLAEIDNMLVPTLPGVGRALEVHRVVPIEALNLFGIPSVCNVKVCEIGPFLCLKLRACGADSDQRHGKDAFDIIHTVQSYDRGPEAAFAAFAAERGVNPAFEEAHAVLARKFADADGPGCVEHAEFSLGALRMSANIDEFTEMHRRERETAALIADRLFHAAHP
jgi:hypothetical protein